MNPVVSICMPTYFHGKYLDKAIKSILDQVVDFEYEIVISDDCSKDDTVDIIKRYMSEYPFIRAIFNTQNIGLSRNIHQVKSMGRGKYSISLAGDDYWIDKYKLQKQYNYLESHPSYSGVCTAIKTVYDDTEIGGDVYPEKRFWNHSFTLDMFLKGDNYPLNGIMTKNYWNDPETKDYFAVMPKVSSFIDDVTNCILILQQGDVFILPDITVAYRVRKKVGNDKNFNSQNSSISIFIKHIEMLNNLDTFLSENVDLFYRYLVVLAPAFRNSLRGRKLRVFFENYSTIPKKYRKRGLLFKVLLHACTGFFKDVIRYVKKVVKR